MPALKNQKHEKFVQGLLTGMSADAAYEAAGYKPHRGNASRLRTDESVVRRLNELKETVAERVVNAVKLDRQWIVEAIIENAEIALGRRKTKKTVKGSGDDPINAEIDIYDRDAAAANAALKLLGQIPEVALFSEVQATEVNVTVNGPAAPQPLPADAVNELTNRFGLKMVAFAASNTNAPAQDQPKKKAAGA